MMGMQALMDAISTASRLARQDYHVTLGGLIDTLHQIPADTIVAFSDGSYPGREDSYRGYYSDLAFEATCESITASMLLKQCENALDSTYTGYKGGDYVIGADTPLWCASYGDTGTAIVDSNLRDNVLVLTTKQLD